MKFGHEFQAALQDFPEEWQGSIIDYKQLKKAIKKLATELRSWGLDSDTLAQLLPDPDSKDAGPESRRGSASFKYEFNGEMAHLHWGNDLDAMLTFTCRRPDDVHSKAHYIR